MVGGRRWIAVSVAGALGVVAGVGLTAAWPDERAEPGWPSYGDAFDALAPSVVNVGVDGAEGRVGTGFAVAPDEVVTARHLVLGAGSLAVRDVTGRRLEARVVGTDARTDLALLKVDGGALPPARLGRSDVLRVGDTVLSIGNPYGLGHTLSVGVIGQRARRLAEAVDGPRVEFLQLSIPLNPGNSGGPVFASDGSVAAVLSGTHGHGQAIAFAVPIESLVATLPMLRAGQHISRAFLGISTGLDGGALVVQSVAPSGPADKAGIRPGDVVLALGGEDVRTPEDLQARLDAMIGGQTASVRLLRDGTPAVLDVALADWAEQPVVAGGMTLRPHPGSGGEVVAVRPRSRAEKAGVRVGDLVRVVDGTPVQAPADVKELLAGGRPVRLELMRDGMAQPLTLGDVP